MSKTVVTWRKSSRSDGQETCVEVANTLSLVRDSKNPGGPTLAVDVAALVRSVRGDDRV